MNIPQDLSATAILTKQVSEMATGLPPAPKSRQLEQVRTFQPVDSVYSANSPGACYKKSGRKNSYFNKVSTDIRYDNSDAKASTLQYSESRDASTKHLTSRQQSKFLNSNGTLSIRQNSRLRANKVIF